MNSDDKHPTPTPRAMQWRLGAILWLLGMACMFAPILWALLLRWTSFQEALFVLLVSNLLYAGLAYAVLLALAVAVGVALAPRVGLAAPALSAWIGRRPVWPALRPQLTPGLCGGLAGAAWLWVLARNTPEVLRPPPSAPEHAAAFIPAKLLVGITDELFMRWTVMTLLLWLVWRLLQRGQGAPGRGLLSTAVVLSALCSAALTCLSTVQDMPGVLTPPVLAFLLLGNTVFGLVMGALYARYGFEAAILAHTLALALSQSFL
ncbi:CPBP family intramembrane metalloprotease [Verminephrobacter aporrectodeae subsp. tuberculatae]|uniref:CPBP family glutamic-type intramembrane protease n=1 Tax=Verminephrobacter aporrectodeae TaxID=1110389 RepID=UPI002238870C|nr:CPBP family glutamic-type intramembrane protease [Verminephrobacter aporrectodeae]MCW5254837.1 CPBP family intramembrane metalloprotease [Verminephrobacter aporrectodeae subsp. tuberculatae]MCW8205529.1 CPBP family intramembrane metalloprotease [Verminephrobacter aporrectodeae subsp. tuberculatae]